MVSSSYGPHSFSWTSAMAEPFVPQGRLIPSAPRAAPTPEIVQADIEPGDKTGVYYILLCNLPFGTSWQDLKDFAECVCQVDHVQVFENSTSGWVRVVGKNNFRKAWKLLDGGYFNGRCIIASDKNKSETIKIKKLVGTPRPRFPLKTSTTPRFLSGLPTRRYPPASSFYHPPFVAAPHVQLPSSGRRNPLVPLPQPFSPQPTVVADRNLTRPAIDSRTLLPSGIGEGRPGFSALKRGSRGRPLGQRPRGQPRGPRPPYAPPHGVTHPGPIENWPQNHPTPPVWGMVNNYVRTEQRKIFVTPFTQEATADEIKVWVHSHVGSYRTQIADIQVPVKGQWSRIRGHAFIIFRDANTTSKAVAILDRREFRGCPVRARLATEGVIVCEQQAAQGRVITPGMHSPGLDSCRVLPRDAASVPRDPEPHYLDKN